MTLRRFFTIAGLGMALTAATLGAAAAPVAAQDAAVGTARGGGQIRITLDCDGSPERTTITNRGNKEIKIESVGSLAGKGKGEPYAVSETLKRGQSITLRSGDGAGGGKDVLTKRELYDDERNRDGARVRTSEGTFKERC